MSKLIPVNNFIEVMLDEVSTSSEGGIILPEGSNKENLEQRTLVVNISSNAKRLLPELEIGDHLIIKNWLGVKSFGREVVFVAAHDIVAIVKAN